MKAQSAIEYLITYGWMLIAVSIVSSAVYSSIGSECIESTSGFTGDSVQITDFGPSASSNDISLLMENRGSENIEINRIRFELTNDSRARDLNEDLNPYESDSVSVSGFQQSDSCNNIDVVVYYDYGSLENQRVYGTLTADIEFDDTVAPLKPESFESDYPDL